MAMLFDPAACRYIYSLRTGYGGTAANQLPILILPPDRIVQLSQHQLSFLFINDIQSL